jgi:hypothetical protein
VCQWRLVECINKNRDHSNGNDRESDGGDLSEKNVGVRETTVYWTGGVKLKAMLR